MRMTYRAMAVALLLTVVCALASGPTGLAQGRSADRSDEILQQSVLRIPANGNFPILKRATLGRGKSLLVQFLFELKDVIVSDAEKVDAVVQSSSASLESIDPSDTQGAAEDV